MGERGVLLPNALSAERIALPIRRRVRSPWSDILRSRPPRPTAADSSSFTNSSSLRIRSATPCVIHPFGFIEVGTQLRKAGTVVSLGFAIEDRRGILPIGVEARVGDCSGEGVAGNASRDP